MFFYRSYYVSDRKIKSIKIEIQYDDGSGRIRTTDLGELRAGDNPHQKGYAGKCGYKIIREGRGMSFTNHLDLTGYAAALELSETMKYLGDRRTEAVVINKHDIPAAFAVAFHQDDALKRAMQYDPKSPFGGVLCTNSPLTTETAKHLKDLRVNCGFTLDVIASPGFEKGAVEQLIDEGDKKDKMFNARVVDLSPLKTIDDVCAGIDGYNITFGIGGNPILTKLDNTSFFNHDYIMETLSHRKPETDEFIDAHLAWIGAKYIRSNSFAFVSDGVLVAECGGQTNREDSARFALDRAEEFGNDVRGSMSATDSFLFDSKALGTLNVAGVAGVVHPTRKDLTTGSLKKDEDILKKIDDYEMIMMRPRLVDEDGNEKPWRVFKHL